MGSCAAAPKTAAALRVLLLCCAAAAATTNPSGEEGVVRQGASPAVSRGAQRKAYFNRTTVIMEGENFTDAAAAASGATPGCRGAAWSACAWGDGGNLFASDVSNVFMSRRAYLHADANETYGAKATAVVPIDANERDGAL